jgi:sulfite exporter TauE/SafE
MPPQPRDLRQLVLADPWTVLLIACGGLAGAGHCLGMCGGFALRLGLSPGSTRRRLTRQVVYGLGRVFSYVALGVVVGAAGMRLGLLAPTFVDVQGWLSVAAGVLLIMSAFVSFGLRLWPRAPATGCLLPGFYGELMRSARATHVLLGGVINGLLPCGLVYTYLALAAATAHPWEGGVVMGLFGLGTLPALAALGLVGGGIPLRWQMSLRRIGAWCILLTGLLTLLRGGLTLTSPRDQDPRCHPAAVAPWIPPS